MLTVVTLTVVTEQLYRFYGAVSLLNISRIRNYGTLGGAITEKMS